MNRKELYKKMKDRKAYNLFNDLEIELSMIPSDGTNIHKIGGLRQSFSSRKRMYLDKEWPIDESFSDYKIRDEQDFNLVMKKILESITYFNIKI